MIALDAAEVTRLVGGRGEVSGTVRGVATDSREAGPGDLFAALAGTRVDGVRFVDDALAAGAVAALVPRRAGGPGRIEVDDPLAALAALAGELRARSAAAVVGITGSTGKTSTKDILAALVAPHADVVASRENQNNELGVPLTLLRIEESTRVAVVEMAMRGPGQIAELAAVARPDIGVITGIGPVHLELLGSIEAIAAAKAELATALPHEGVAIVPHGEPLLEPHLSAVRARVVTFGWAADADVRVRSFTAEGAGGRAEIAVRGRIVRVPVNFTAPHNALNLAAATAAYEALGLPLDGLAEGAGRIAFSRWRGQELELAGGGVLIADCYNANPTSMRAALEHLTSIARGRRRVAVIGDMAELGPAGPEYHREIAALLDGLGIESTVAVGELSRAYDADRWFATAAEAAAAVGEVVQPGDAVLVKASRSVGLEAVVEAVAP